MAETLSADVIDFAAYQRETECKAKVRKASDYDADLLDAINAHHEAETEPDMNSTKLRGLLRFRPGEVTAWAGYNGHKKSFFTGQVALDLCTQGRKVLIMSMEMRPVQTLLRMSRQAAGDAGQSAEWARGFSAWTDGKLWLFDHMGRITPAFCVAVCRYFAEELGGTDVFVDSMMMVVASEEHMDEQKQLTTDLVRLAQESGLHIHLVAHCRKPGQGGEERPPTKYELRGSAAVSDQCANVVIIWANKAKKAECEKTWQEQKLMSEPDAIVSVEKQRNGTFEGKVMLWFDQRSHRFIDDLISPVRPYAQIVHLDPEAARA